MINPKHLRAFLSVAQQGSVIRASEILRRAQSAVTRSIKELEGELGVPLFERKTNGMLLTDFGRAFLRRTEAAFREMETAKRGFAAFPAAGTWNEHAPIFSLSVSWQRLLVLIELMEHRHMRVVADSLSISQPAVSQILRELEMGVCVDLIARTPGGLQPTALGTLLALHVRRALAEIRAGEAELASLAGATAGEVRIGTLSLGRILLQRAILDFNKAHPNVVISTVEGSYDYLAMLLRSGDIDFVIGALRPPEQMVGLVSEVVAEDVIVLVVRSAHPLAGKSDLGFADLESTNWVLPQRGTPTRESLERALRARGIHEPTVVVETADVTITRGLILESDFISAVSHHWVQREVDVGDLVVLPLRLPATERAIGIIQRSQSLASVAARLLMESIRRVP